MKLILFLIEDDWNELFLLELDAITKNITSYYLLSLMPSEKVWLHQLLPFLVK